MEQRAASVDRSAKGALSFQPGATPQDSSYTQMSAESALQDWIPGQTAHRAE
jgi:hypothetical protein